jgi:hypothetical protein
MPVCQATTTACYFRVDNLVIWGDKLLKHHVKKILGMKTNPMYEGIRYGD